MLRLGLPVAFVVLVADQLAKLWAVSAIGPGSRDAVTGFFNIVLTFNPGISFSLFQNEAWGPWVFSILALVVVAVLIVWLRRASSIWLGVAIGGIVGGALGNTVDRMVYGAVVDFLDFHAMGYHWPAFNVADSAIVTGVVMILTEGLVFRGRKSVDGDDNS
ncbi:MAG: signal peptidase II [Proteobacteria bacterium]|nr:signal peptidase II [Pseudomonadota bacterium]MDA1058271.1 signal peptidase II [Pseudomonadota bacterium]